MSQCPFEYSSISGKYAYIATSFADGITVDGITTVDIELNKVINIAHRPS